MFGVQKGGSSTKHETYARKTIEQGTGKPCPPTSMRINKRTNEMVEIAHPMKNDNGFDFTENFDGKQVFGQTTAWVNLKSVVGTGGSQTRTLRDECYPFVDAQLNFLLKSKKTDMYFANIFDGDEAAAKKKMFDYLLTLPEFAGVKKYVYVGDLLGYFAWLKTSIN